MKKGGIMIIIYGFMLAAAVYFGYQIPIIIGDQSMEIFLVLKSSFYAIAIFVAWKIIEEIIRRKRNG